ncbi:hypothetical protein JA33_047 [Dickeya phage vB_DsoM_JA33]|uniref:Uncharacterized protein n=2 Tax=Salmondvirus JA11 TaxID=2734141 RepID=A0A386K583_9CAUD|nr:hypothetical protein HOU32_gp047 [Dickeya phage vB_DsoM_JA11]AXG67421.1 hypothetical protein JA33_047 [Dickeya phage vB_DsoM_JA33]AYD79852.1 hypothetical protein JA11_047 [Dickeya phage vB_DsoM_JA11]
MELNEIDRWQECLHEFGGIPVGTSVDSIPIDVLNNIRHYLEPKGSRVFLLPYYGLEVAVDVQNNIDLNMETIPNRFITESAREKLSADPDQHGTPDIHYIGAKEVIQEMLLQIRAHYDAVQMHRFDDFLIYSETEFGMWELWFHKSGDCSVAHAPKYMDFNAWVEERSQTYIGVSCLNVPNTLYEIEGQDLLRKFVW